MLLVDIFEKKNQALSSAIFVCIGSLSATACGRYQWSKCPAAEGTNGRTTSRFLQDVS